MVSSEEVARLRWSTLNAALRTPRGVDGSSTTTPSERVESKLTIRNNAVDISTVRSYSDVINIVDHVAVLKTGARYGALTSPRTRFTSTGGGRRG
jgi:hypothetical protein